jgi:hypothetical protein
MVKTYKIFIATMIVISSVLTSGCSCAKPATPVIVTPTEIAVKATETPMPVATETPVVTVEVKATETPAPTSTPVPTDTPAPTATATPTPEPTVHVHEWKSEVTEATCTAEGKIVYTCECGETYSEVIGKKEHAAGEPERVEPTVESEGKIIIKCSVCGEVLSEEIIARLTPTPTNTPVPTATNTPTPTPEATAVSYTREQIIEMLKSPQTPEEFLEVALSLGAFKEGGYDVENDTSTKLPLTMDYLSDAGSRAENGQTVYILYMPADFEHLSAAKYFYYSDAEHTVLLYTRLVWIG